MNTQRAIVGVVLFLALGSACAIGVAAAGSIWKEAPAYFAASLLAEPSPPGDVASANAACVRKCDSWGASDRGMVVYLESSPAEADIPAVFATPQNFAQPPEGRGWLYLTCSWIHHRSGWPASCVQGLTLRADERNVSTWAMSWQPRWTQGMYMIEENWDRRGIPWIPIWPGLLINTLFYAGILRLLFTTPGRVRRRLRRRRGLCPKCAYPCGGRGVCSECGAPVRSRWEGGM